MRRYKEIINGLFIPAAIIRGDRLLFANDPLKKLLGSPSQNVHSWFKKRQELKPGIYKQILTDSTPVTLYISKVDKSYLLLLLQKEQEEFFEQICHAVDEYIWTEDKRQEETYSNKKLRTSSIKMDIQKHYNASQTSFTSNNQTYTFRYSKTPLYKRGKVIGSIKRAIDITPYTKLLANRNFLQKVLDSIEIGIVVATLDGKILYANHYITKMLHTTKEELTQKRVTDFLDPPYAELWLQRAMQNTTEPIQLPLYIHNQQLWINATGRNVKFEDRTYRIITIIDISTIKEQQEQLYFLLNFDPLTHLYNRNTTIKLIQKRLKERSEYGALLLLDIDQFKEINEVYSHSIADELLILLSHRLRHLCDYSNIIGRIDGDQFLILLDFSHNDCNFIEKKVAQIAKILQKKLTKPYTIDGTTIKISLSIAITITDPSTSLDILLQKLESTIYHAKRRRNNLILLFDERYLSQIKENKRIREELKIALAKKEFKIAYQPQIKLIDNKPHVVGYEALIRWIKDGQIVPPAKFIPVAEESGLVIDIGLYVIEEACRILERKKGFKIAVNISPKQFEDKEFVQKSLQIIKDYNFDNSRLVFEITESILLHDIQDALNKIEQITYEGVCFAIDDFGTGYSSFEYLKKLPLSELKIDRSFVQNITTNRTDQVITQAIIDIAHLFEMEVVAEGVETKEQVELLQKLGADIFQGYYFGKPTFNI